jgi:sugar phosphate permease
LMGVGVATVTPAASNLILRFTPVEKLGTVFSIRQIGVPIGAGIAGAGVPALLLVTGWQMVLLLIGAVLAVTALSFQPVRASFDDDRDRRASVRPGSILQPLRMVMNDPALRGISVGGFAFNIMQSGLLSYLVTYATLELHYSLVTAGLILTAAQLAAVFARMFWGWMADRLGDPLRILSLLGFISAAMCLVLGSITPQWPVELVVAAAFVFGATAVSWNGVYRWTGAFCFARAGRHGNVGVVVLRLLWIAAGAVAVFPDSLCQRSLRHRLPVVRRGSVCGSMEHPFHPPAGSTEYACRAA